MLQTKKKGNTKKCAKYSGTKNFHLDSPIGNLTHQTPSNTLIQTAHTKRIPLFHLHPCLNSIHWIHPENGNGPSSCRGGQVGFGIRNSF